MLQGLYKRFNQASLDSQRIFKGMVTVAGLLIIAKAIAAAKEVVLAHSYGTSAVLDGHLFAFNLASWPVSVLAAALWFGLTPAWVKLSGQDAHTKKQAAADLLGLVLVLALVAAVVVAGVLYWLLVSNASGLSAVAQAAALDSMWAVLLFLLLGCLATLYATWLMSAQRHGNTLLESAPAAAIALCVLVVLSLGHTDLGVGPLNMGLALGAFVQLGVLAWLFRADGPTSISWPRRGSVAWSLLHGMGLALLAQVVMSSSVLIDTFALARMGDSAITTYTYAQRVMALAISLTAVAITRALLPVLSAQKDLLLGLALVRKWAFKMFCLGCLFAVLIFYFSEPIIRIIFERGAFLAQDTTAVSLILKILSIQLPFYMVSTVYFSWLIANGSTSLYLVIATIGVAMKMAFLNLFFDIGIPAIAMSTVFMYIAYSLIVYVYWILKSRIIN